MERDLGVWAGGKLHTSQQCALAAKTLCPGVHQAPQSRLGDGGDCLTLHCSDVAPPGALCIVCVQRKVTKMVMDSRGTGADLLSLMSSSRT